MPHIRESFHHICRDESLGSLETGEPALWYQDSCRYTWDFTESTLRLVNLPMDTFWRRKAPRQGPPGYALYCRMENVFLRQGKHESEYSPRERSSWARTTRITLYCPWYSVKYRVTHYDHSLARKYQIKHVKSINAPPQRF